MLKSQDIYVLPKLVVTGGRQWSYADLAFELRMSPSQLHYSVRRALSAHLAVKVEGRIIPHFRNLEEFLIHGLKYVFWPQYGSITRGLPTAYAAPPLNTVIRNISSEPPPVWPDPRGEARGIAFAPLYKHAPVAARADKTFYEHLTLADSLRSGRARERDFAARELQLRLSSHAQDYQS